MRRYQADSVESRQFQRDSAATTSKAQVDFRLGFNWSFNLAGLGGGFTLRAFGKLSLHPEFCLPLLLFLPLHFFLAFLKAHSAQVHLLEVRQ